MKQKARLYFLIFGLCFSVKANVSSRSYFSVTPLFRPTMPEMVTVMHDKVEEQYPRNKIDFVMLGSISCCGKELAKYFLPNGKTEIIAAGLGSEVAKSENADVISTYFNVWTTTPLTTASTGTIDQIFAGDTFVSKVKFNPSQKMFGGAFRYRRHLSEFTNKGFWVEFTIPVVYVKNDVGLEEEIIKPGGPTGENPTVPEGYVANMKAAFKQTSWVFGKIDGAKKKIGIADIYLRLGYDYVKEPTHHLASFVGLVIPTGNKPNGEYLFEPIVGNGGHAGIFFGASAGFRIWCRDCHSIYWRLDTNGTMLTENVQKRSFDLKGKPWSRYMWVYLDKTSSSAKQGINTFTESFKVTPETVRDLNTAFIFESTSIKAEAGYHFLAKQAEHLKFAAAWNNGPAIAAITEPTSCTDSKFILTGKSRNNATINRYAKVPNDVTSSGVETYKALQESDFDIESAANPSTISHTFYADIAYLFGRCKDKYVKFGGAYEFSADNTSINRWYLWTRLGIDF